MEFVRKFTKHTAMQHIFEMLDRVSPMLVIAAILILLIVLDIIDKKKRKPRDNLEDYYRDL